VQTLFGSGHVLNLQMTTAPAIVNVDFFMGWFPAMPAGWTHGTFHAAHILFPPLAPNRHPCMAPSMQRTLDLPPVAASLALSFCLSLGLPSLSNHDCFDNQPTHSTPFISPASTAQSAMRCLLDGFKPNLLFLPAS
jgi:hypothetical protein